MPSSGLIVSFPAEIGRVILCIFPIHDGSGAGVLCHDVIHCFDEEKG